MGDSRIDLQTAACVQRQQMKQSRLQREGNFSFSLFQTLSPTFPLGTQLCNKGWDLRELQWHLLARSLQIISFYLSGVLFSHRSPPFVTAHSCVPAPGACVESGGRSTNSLWLTSLSPMGDWLQGLHWHVVELSIYDCVLESFILSNFNIQPLLLLVVVF